jgi:histidine triad (HIT) family protein
VDCLFCKIAAGQIPAKLVHESDELLAFRDVNPQAPTHVLVIPRRHIATVNELTAAEATLAGSLITTAQEIAMKEGIAESGYRLIFNCNGDGGQSVYHIHLHLIGGRPMRWPPG